MGISIDWHSVFVPGIGIAEVVVRGSIMYLCMLAILRFVGRRQAGHFAETNSKRPREGPRLSPKPTVQIQSRSANHCNDKGRVDSSFRRRSPHSNGG